MFHLTFDWWFAEKHFGKGKYLAQNRLGLYSDDLYQIIYLDINLFVGQHFAAWTFSTEAHRTISSSFDLEIEDLMIESIHWYSLNTMLYDRSFWKWTFISGCCIRILMISSITIEFTVWYSYLIVYGFTVCLQSGQSVHCSNELKETIWIGCWKR